MDRVVDTTGREEISQLGYVVCREEKANREPCDLSGKSKREYGSGWVEGTQNAVSASVFMNEWGRQAAKSISAHCGACCARLSYKCREA